MALRIAIIAVIIAVCSAQSSPPPSGATSPPPSSGTTFPPSRPEPQCGKLNLTHDDYSDGSAPPPAPPSGRIYTQAAPPSTAVSAICPQLGGQSQCCADTFFTDARMKLFGDLRDGLVKQSSPQIGVFHTIAMELNNYFMNSFASEIANNFANNTNPPSIQPNSNPRMDNFNISAVVYQLLGGLISAIKQNGLRLDRICIDGQAAVVFAANRQSIQAMAKDLALVRNITAAFNLFDQYAINATMNVISKVPPNNQCLNALLKLTCSKCQKSIPMLCRNVCGAVIKGCYAPYADRLNPQFNILWNVSSQLAQVLVNALNDFFMQQSIIRKALIDGLMTGCSITVPSNVTTVPPQGLGNQFLKKVQTLLNSGLLFYDPTNGPAMCNSSSITARAECWNGTMQVANDIPQFMVSSIYGQAKNPVSPFDETQLAQQVQSIGAPVSSLLSSPDVAVAISGAAITIPNDQTSPTTSDGSVGPHAVSLSLLSLLFALTSMLSQ